MALDPTPWFIGDPGATHSAEVARLAANAPGGSEDGIFAPTDLKVLPYASPGAGVRIQAGAWKGQNRASGGRSQAFIGRNISDTNVAIAGTGASVRYDLICLVARDPSIPGSGGTVGGPYHLPYVASGVSATTTRLQQVSGQEFTSGYALARVAVPANSPSPVIQASHITDLRQLASAQSKTEWAQVTSTGQIGTQMPQDALIESSFRRWPDAAAFQIPIPLWATHAIIRGSVESYTVKSGSTTGRLRASFVGQSTPHTSFDENWTGNNHRNSLAFGGEVPIAAQYRGTTQQLNFDGHRGGVIDGYVDADLFTNSLVTVIFQERVA